MLSIENFEPRVFDVLDATDNIKLWHSSNMQAKKSCFVFVGSELCLIMFEAAFQFFFEFRNDVWNTHAVKSASMKLKLGSIVDLVLVNNQRKKVSPFL